MRHQPNEIIQIQLHADISAVPHLRALIDVPWIVCHCSMKCFLTNLWGRVWHNYGDRLRQFATGVHWLKLGIYLFSRSSFVRSFHDLDPNKHEVRYREFDLQRWLIWRHVNRLPRNGKQGRNERGMTSYPQCSTLVSSSNRSQRPWCTVTWPILTVTWSTLTQYCLGASKWPRLSIWSTIRHCSMRSTILRWHSKTFSTGKGIIILIEKYKFL